MGLKLKYLEHVKNVILDEMAYSSNCIVKGKDNTLLFAMHRVWYNIKYKIYKLIGKLICM